MPNYKSIDLFAGIGGIRLGFDRAFGKNIETVFVSEWDENAKKTYSATVSEEKPVETKAVAETKTEESAKETPVNTEAVKEEKK